MQKISICSENNQDLQGMSKTKVDKTNSSFVFTKQNIANKTSEKEFIQSKSVTPSKSNSTTKTADDINNTSNAFNNDSNLPPKLRPEPKQPTYSDIKHRSSNLSISSHQMEPLNLFIDVLVEETVLTTTSGENITGLSALHQILK